MMIFAAPPELARVSHSPQAAFRPVLGSAAQRGRPVEIQEQEHGRKEGIELEERATPDREKASTAPFSLLLDETLKIPHENTILILFFFFF